MLRDGLNTESQTTRTPKYSPMYVRANDLARSDSLKVLYTISCVTK